MRPLSPTDVHALKVSELGLDASAADLTTIESLAAALRRAAGFLCPCSHATLVRAVVRPLEGLVTNLEEIRDSIDATLEAMVAYGDLLEQPSIGDDAEAQHSTLLYAAPPSFVPRLSGAALLLGITPDERSPLPREFEARVEHINHVRRLPANPPDDLRVELARLGLVELSFESWLKAPPVESPARHVERLDQLLDRAAPSSAIPGLFLLDSKQPVRYYRGRWMELRRQTGRFVARRSQAYGADLWCYAQIREGLPERFVDLLLRGGKTRGCDEAWRLQMAIDALSGKPQLFRRRLGPLGTRVFEFFSPVPLWARRRWDALGEPVASTGCLFAYRFRESDVDEETRFMRDNLWLAELPEPR